MHAVLFMLSKVTETLMISLTAENITLPWPYTRMISHMNARYRMYDYDAMHLTHRKSHQLIIRADQFIRRNHMHVACTSCAK